MSARTAIPFVIRNFNTLEMEHFVRPPLYESLGGSLTKGTAASKLGASIDTLPPGKRCCPFHLHHAQEEMFIVLNGRGTLRIGDEERAIEEGDVICIPPGKAWPHQIINTSDQPLRYISISTMESPEICEYPDADKFLARARINGKEDFRRVDFRGEGVDYWEGEK
ncbi:cupin domain-containing protein [Kosakonia radicincitans]|uniref:cupin domain-containing protein n=1 Tax=Kosakonia radicincitans TaxID=283686 RepID=UPI0011EF4A19|nr:cupin domain-containing protein [Kosakonia radicincitans]QEM91714.1 cupin domain-containing protein [Kosakonia radicincitans]